MKATPPRLAEKWLRAVISDPHAREGLVGDLGEEYALVAQRFSVVGAYLWYWFAAAVTGGWYIYARVREGRHARRGFGAASRTKKQPMRALLQDIRFAWRGLRRAPGFSAVVVVTLVLGIGANTAIFSLLNTLLFRPLPFLAPGELVRMRDALERPGEPPWLYNTSTRSFVLLEDHAEVFDGIVAQRHRIFNVTNRGDPARVTGIGVSANWLSVLGISPLVGRGFSAEEEREGRDSRVVVLGYGLWQRMFGADSSALEEPLTLDGLPYTVIGVMRPRFNFPYGAGLWVPATFERDGTNFDPHVTARLKSGLTVATAQVGLDELSRRMAQQYPETHSSVTFTAVPLRDDLVDNHPRLGWILLGGVAFLLLIGCANVANLLLVRSMSRRRELATRSVLGASRSRMVGQLIAESTILVAVATGLALLFAAGLTNVLATLSVSATGSLGEFFQHVRIDHRVFGFSLVIALVTALLFGAMPAVKASRFDVRALLQERGRIAGRAGQRASSVLVVAEVALALILLNGAGLMVQSFATLQRRDLGYQPDNRLLVDLAMPLYEYSSVPARLQFVENVLERVEAVPGVLSAGVTQHLPLSPGSDTQRFTIEGGPASEPGNELLTNLRIVSSGYHATMGIPLRQGRLFSDEEDRGRAPPAVIVNEPMAERFWAGTNPIGKRVKFGGLDSRGPWRTVVGVVGDVDERFEVEETWYIPYGHAPVRDLTLVVQTAQDPSSLTLVIRAAIWQIDPDLPVDDVQTMTGLVAESRSEDRLSTYLMGVFAVFAVLLAGLGIYAVISYTVAQQTRDIGIRMALGSDRSRILASVLKRGTALVGMGVLIGVPGAVQLTRAMSSVLAGGNANVPLELGMVSEVMYLQPPTYAGIAFLLVVVALLACYLPAHRAAKLDPMEVLRQG